MRVVKPAEVERELPRGVVGGAEISQATTGAHNLYMGLIRVPAGGRPRPHFHPKCESAGYMGRGGGGNRGGGRPREGPEGGQGGQVSAPPPGKPHPAHPSP